MDVRSVATSPSPRKRTSQGRTKPGPKPGTKPKTAATKPRKSATPTTPPKTATPPKAETHAKHAKNEDRHRTITLTVPTAGRVASGAANAALLPVAVARQVLPAKGGLPLYLGLGVLGAVDVLEWPVAIGIGVGYAVLRRGGALAPGRSSGAAHAA